MRRVSSVIREAASVVRAIFGWPSNRSRSVRRRRSAAAASPDANSTIARSRAAGAWKGPASVARGSSLLRADSRSPMAKAWRAVLMSSRATRDRAHPDKPTNSKPQTRRLNVGRLFIDRQFGIAGRDMSLRLCKRLVTGSGTRIGQSFSPLWRCRVLERLVWRIGTFKINRQPDQTSRSSTIFLHGFCCSLCGSWRTLSGFRRCGR